MVQASRLRVADLQLVQLQGGFGALQWPGLATKGGARVRGISGARSAWKITIFEEIMEKHG